MDFILINIISLYTKRRLYFTAMEGKHFSRELKILNYGTHQMNTPNQPAIQVLNEELNVCSKCISIFPTNNSLLKHFDSCKIPFTPIYEEQDFKISKISSLDKKQLLSLITQIFIKSKTVYYEVANYDFFILYDTEIIGYYSKYRDGPSSLNCLLVFPCFQGCGWGTVLFDFCNIPVTSSDKSPEKNLIFQPLSPEKPYSKKAIFCFRKYWKYKVIGGNTINEISQETNLPVNDVILGLEQQGFDFKKWKLSNMVHVKKPRILSKRVFWLKTKKNNGKE